MKSVLDLGKVQYDKIVENFGTIRKNDQLMEECLKSAGFIPNDGPRWDCWVTDDHSPLDWSLAFLNGKVYLRLIWEPQPADTNNISLSDHLDLSFKTIAYFKATYGIDTSLIDNLSSLLVANSSCNIWIATDFEKFPFFKVYLTSPHQLWFGGVLEKLGTLQGTLEIKKFFKVSSIDLVAVDLVDPAHSRTKVLIFLFEKKK